MATRQKAKNAIHLSGRVMLYVFAGIGVAFTGVFFAIRLHWTNVAGTVDLRSSDFQAISEVSAAGIGTTPTSLTQTANTSPTQSMKDINSSMSTLEDTAEQLAKLKQQKQHTLCRIQVMSAYDGEHSANMLRLYSPTQSDTLINKMLFALEPYIADTAAYNTQMESCDSAENTKNITVESTQKTINENSTHPNLFAWIQSDEWPILEQAIQKDTAAIHTAAEQADVEERLIVSALIVEQLRLYHTQRALFKEFFEPLNILASATKTSWGVMSIKEDTAIAIENHLTDPASPYYLGSEYEHVLDFDTNDHATERYNRLTNEHDHTYAYLYGALYIKQFITQWKNAGYDISNRPEILATLFNIGFNYSHPKATPQVGGAAIEMANTQYTFGGLAFEFYYSGELMDAFPLHP